MQMQKDTTCKGQRYSLFKVLLALSIKVNDGLFTVFRNFNTIFLGYEKDFTPSIKAF